MATFPLTATDRKQVEHTYASADDLIAVSDKLDTVHLGKIISQLPYPDEAPDLAELWLTLCTEHSGKARLRTRLSKAATKLVPTLVASKDRAAAELLYKTTIDPLAPGRFDAWWEKQVGEDAAAETAEDEEARAHAAGSPPTEPVIEEPEPDVSHDAAELIENAMDADSFGSEKGDDAAPLVEEPPARAKKPKKARAKKTSTRAGKAYDSGPKSSEWPTVRVSKLDRHKKTVMVTAREGYFQTEVDENGVVQATDLVLDAERTCPRCGHTLPYEAFGPRFMAPNGKSGKFVRRPQTWCLDCRKVAAKESAALRRAQEQARAAKKGGKA